VDKHILTSISLILVGLLHCTSSSAAKIHSLCVFDPVGKSGDIYTSAKDLSAEFLSAGVQFQLYPYSTESEAKSDFNNGLCDATVLTTTNASEYNHFTASIDAMGATLNYRMQRDVIHALSQPKANDLMRQGKHEIAGIFPGGAVHLLFHDRAQARPDNIENTRLLVLHGSPVLRNFAEQLNLRAIRGDTSNFAQMFKRNRVDAIFAPITIIQALELEQAMGTKGGMLSTPFMYLSLQLVINRDKFPVGFGQQARVISLHYFDDAVRLARQAKFDIGKEYWISSNAQQLAHWNAVMLEVQRNMLSDKTYDPRMLKLLKKTRCKYDPIREECSNKSLVAPS